MPELGPEWVLEGERAPASTCPERTRGQAAEGVRLLGGNVERVFDAVEELSRRDLGQRMEVTIIRAGESNNRLRYSASVLEAAAPLFEGAAAFCDHPTEMDMTRAGGRSLRDLVGVYEGVNWDPGSSSVKGTLRLYPGAEWLASLVKQALGDREAGRRAPDVGVSADMLVVKSPIVEPPGGDLRGSGHYGRLLGYEVRRIERVISADVVFRPAAGGRFDRIVEGAGGREGEGEVLICTVCEQEVCTCQATRTAEGGDAGASGGRGAMGTLTGSTATATATATREAAGDRRSPLRDEGSTALVQSETGLAVARELEAVRAVRLELCRGLLDQRLAVAQGLPVTAGEYLRGRFRDRIFEASELDGEIAALRNMLGGIVAGGVVRGMGLAGAGRVEVGANALDRVHLGMDRLFGLRLADSADYARFSGIREAYLAITGDKGFTGFYRWEDSVLAGAREADEVTTSIMANIVANSMTKRLGADYQAQPKWWLPFVTRVPLRDMKVQDRIMLNDFAVFPTVNENAAYVNLAWDDAKETYTPAKKGSVVYITLETIINDDLRAVARIPSKLAAAAAVTINEFVSGLFTANSGAGSQMTDTYYVFNAAQHQSNSGTTALSSDPGHWNACVPSAQVKGSGSSGYSFGPASHKVLKGEYQNRRQPYNLVEIYGKAYWDYRKDSQHIHDSGHVFALKEADWLLDSQADVGDRRDRLHYANQAKLVGGELDVLPHLGAELYDVVDVTASRAGLSSAVRRVAGIRWRYDGRKGGIWLQRLELEAV